ncbi:MAG TPA: hypothetical protein VN824_15105, partial [Puia sp.]|nr:hypothetical protein [Puia sp.]
MKFQLRSSLLILLVFIINTPRAQPQQKIVNFIRLFNDPRSKKIEFNNKKLRLLFDYDHKAAISSLIVNGQKVIDDPAGIYSEIKAN